MHFKIQKPPITLFTSYHLNQLFIIPRVTSTAYPNYIQFVKDGCGSPECLTGYFADVFHELQEKLNFTYSVTTNNAGGIKLKNGSWTGMLGLY